MSHGRSIKAGLLRETLRSRGLSEETIQSVFKRSRGVNGALALGKLRESLAHRTDLDQIIAEATKVIKIEVTDVSKLRVEGVDPPETQVEEDDGGHEGDWLLPHRHDGLPDGTE